jgi:hypothetical protein
MASPWHGEPSAYEVFEKGSKLVGLEGFEPSASTSRTWRANQAALQPVYCAANSSWPKWDFRNFGAPGQGQPLAVRQGLTFERVGEGY